MKALLRVRFPSHVDVTGRNASGQMVKLKFIDIPLHFTSPKGPTSAAFIDLIVGEKAEDANPDQTLGEHILMVSGRDGSVKIQSSRNDYVEPAFMSKLGKDKPAAEGEGDDDDDAEEGDEGDDEEGDAEEGEEGDDEESDDDDESDDDEGEDDES